MLHLSQPNDNTEQHLQEEEYRSVSDYVGGLHGGKYVFDPRISGVTAINYEKSVLFGDVIDSSSNMILAAPAGDGTLPDWAQRSVDYESQVKGEVHLATGDAQQVQLMNEELSWEPFYVMIETAAGAVIEGGTNIVQVSPWKGMLAPRGGRNQYTDHCSLLITRIDDGTISAFHVLGGQQLYLVVRTECEFWVWRLMME